MKRIVRIAFLILGLNLHAQKNDVSLVLSSNYDFNKISITGNTFFNGGSFIIGCKVNKFTLFTLYQFGNSRNRNKHVTNKNSYNYHQIGLGVKYSILNNPPILSPFIQIKLSTQIATNYKDGLMNNGAGSIIQTTQSLYDLYMTHGTYFDTYEEYDSWVGNRYYQSTRFLGSLTFGADLKLFKGLELNVGTGFGIREIVTKRPITDFIETYWKYSIDIQAGLSYAIPLRKKKEL